MCPIDRLEAPERHRARDGAENLCTASDSAISGLRYYSPSIGRWPNRDPIRDTAFHSVSATNVIEDASADVQSLSLMPLYAFLGNSPINAVDLLGLATVSKRRDGTFNVGLEACEIVRVIDHGIRTRMAYRFAFAAAKQGPSVAGFMGCYADEINRAIDSAHLLTGSPTGPPWNDTVSPYLNKTDWATALTDTATGAQTLAASWLGCKQCTSVKVTAIGRNGGIGKSRVFTAADVKEIAKWVNE